MRLGPSAASFLHVLFKLDPTVVGDKTTQVYFAVPLTVNGEDRLLLQSPAHMALIGPVVKVSPIYG